MTADHPALDQVVLSTRRNTWTLGGEVEVLTEIIRKRVTTKSNNRPQKTKLRSTITIISSVHRATSHPNKQTYQLAMMAFNNPRFDSVFQIAIHCQYQGTTQHEFENNSATRLLYGIEKICY